jgi:hypothetical protein
MTTKRTAVPKVPAVFAPVVAAFAADPDVTAGTMFSAENVVLKVRGKIFAMWARGALVVKLPRERVAELLAEDAVPFEPSPGRVMKEWIALPGRKKAWVALAREAYAFVVAGIPKGGGRRRGTSAPRTRTSRSIR